MIEDYDLIVSSFQTQYGLRLSKEIHEMPWGEFKQMLSGIGPDTPLGRIVAVRTENDKDVLKRFSKEQHRIRNEWRGRRAKEMPPEDMERILDGFKRGFIALSGK